ncbi:winged helix-turn-helix domain-containing protein [Nocardiopsis sp. CC223A]|uniref:winged helix-turn-helix domain-containing protein n=1 Tax=Nocardiopsis sp. CC223A TaxID=3044051 RepID=UPI00278C2A93|nr:helix-turn-helix domain-containing protein [Nocardiopsis sp. CC223A]
MTTTATSAASRRSAEHTRTLILTALTETPEPVTVAALAEETGLGTSTLAKHLTVLEKEDKAVRTPGGRDGRKRLPDTWQAAPAPEPTSAEDSVETVPAPPSPQEDQLADLVQETAEDSAETTHTPGTPTEADDPAPSTPNGPVPASRAAAPTPVAAKPLGSTPEADLNPVSGSTRLGPGELKLMVRAILDASPGEEFTATEISHLLGGRSIGAIQNNLARLAKEGRAVQTCDKPRRYRSAKTGN